MHRWFKIGFGILLFISSNIFAQSLPTNIGFEKGNFDGWECSIGNRELNKPDPTDLTPSLPLYGRHSIIDTNSKNILDDYGHFPILCPNGSNYSIQLGIGIGLDGIMQRVSYKFKIPDNVTSYSIVFNYAVVLENPSNHTLEEQPLFTAKVFDVTDNAAVACPSFEFAASGSLVNDRGFKLSDKHRLANASVFYKDWSTAMINLTSYAGKEVRIEFTTEDCKRRGHFGYAYLDVDEVLSVKPITGNVFCSNQTETKLIGPTGFAEYKWYKGGDLTQVPLTGQTIVVPAEDGQRYVLGITPYPNLGCPDFLDITLKKLPEPFNLVVTDKVYGCPGYGADITAASVTDGSSSGMKLSYYKDAAGLEYLPNPKTITTDGIYYIRGTNDGGCTDIKPVQVIISEPEISVPDHINIQYPATVDLSTMFTPQGGYTYSYFKDAGLKESISVPPIVNTAGTYYIRATNINHCSLVVPVKVIVDPPPPYQIKASNTFTPNGDGVNDKFFITINGYASFGTLNIFNRYGQKVFTSKSISNYWDGNEGSKQIPEGTYYWIFEGSDDYFHTKITKSGSVTIIR